MRRSAVKHVQVLSGSAYSEPFAVAAAESIAVMFPAINSTGGIYLNVGVSSAGPFTRLQDFIGIVPYGAPAVADWTLGIGAVGSTSGVVRGVPFPNG